MASPLQFIKNDIERECTEYVYQYIRYHRNLYNLPYEELLRVREKYEEFFIIQPPYINNAGRTQWNDLSVMSKKNNIDKRFEFCSLNVRGGIDGKVLRHAFEAHNIPERELVLVCIGEGYEEVVEYTLRPQIKQLKLRVSPIVSIAEYKRYIDTLFRKI